MNKVNPPNQVIICKGILTNNAQSCDQLVSLSSDCIGADGYAICNTIIPGFVNPDFITNEILFYSKVSGDSPALLITFYKNNINVPENVVSGYYWGGIVHSWSADKAGYINVISVTSGDNNNPAILKIKYYDNIKSTIPIYYELLISSNEVTVYASKSDFNMWPYQNNSDKLNNHDNFHIVITDTNTHHKNKIIKHTKCNKCTKNSKCNKCTKNSKYN